MKASRIRDMSIDELQDEEKNLSEQLFKLRVQKSTGQLENAVKMRLVRKDLARVKTIRGEKEQALEN